jgi:pimeloyl-ACP methyl ester carboxylesterase
MPHASLPDFDLCYDDHGDDRGEGPVALFLHGFPLDRTLWRHQLSALAGVRLCIAPDLRGFGASACAPTGPVTMERHADDLAALLDHLGVGQVDLVGLSMGGYVQLAFWERHRSRVRSLALLNTRATEDDAQVKAKRNAAAASLLEEGRASWARDTVGMLVAPEAGVDVRAQVQAMIEHTRHDVIVAALMGMKGRPDRTALLRTIDVPALVLASELDTTTPPDGMGAMAAAIPGARLEVLAGVGHLTPLEAPDAVTRVLQEFLASLPAG